MPQITTACQHHRKPRLIAIVSVLLAAQLLTFVGPARGANEENILQNGDLTHGTGDAPAGWQSDAWQSGAEITTYRWYHSGNGPGVVEIHNAKPNDARWVQKLHLAPGWYHFTASIRTEDVGQDNDGGNLSVLEDGIISPEVHGSHDWETTGLYLKVGRAGADIELACRLGGYSSLNTGTAFCRDLKGVKIEAPPADANPKYDLDVTRGGAEPQAPAPSAEEPSASGGAFSTTILLVGALLVLAALLGTRGMRKKVLEAIRLPVESSPPPQRTIAQADSPKRETEIAIFLVCILSFAFFYQASDHSTATRIDLIRAILERHTLWTDGYAGFNTADIMEWHSHIYPAKAPGGAFTGILPWIFARIVVSPFLAQGGLYWALVTYLTTVLSVSLLVALTAVVAYRFGLLLGAGHGRSVAVALTLAFATIMFPYATEFTGEPISAFCIFTACYLLALPDDGQGWWRALGAGLLAGWSFLCDYTTLLLAVIVALYALWRLRNWRKLVPFDIGAAAVAVLLLVHNEIAFGNPFFLSYEAYMSPSNTRFPEQRVGFVGVTYPKLSILWKVLFDPQRGLFFCNPVLLLAIPGLFFFWRRRELRAEFALIASSILVFILLNGSFVDSIRIWGGGTATGPRHMVPVLPFIALAIVFIPDELTSVFGALALASAFLMLMATSIEPHLPYEYSNPFRDFVWPAYLRGDFAYNRSPYFGGEPIAGDSVAFNLSKLIGLPGWLQLWPLAALWVASALYFLKDSEWSFGRANMRVAAVIAIVAIFAPPTVGSVLADRTLEQAHGLLGCYYEGSGLNGFPPHIRRVDRQIDFDTIAELGALPSPSFVVWSGKLIAPAAGLYRFDIAVDDSGWLKIDGQTVIADPGNVSKAQDSGSITLTSGAHSIEVGERNIWGGASMHLRWQPPGGTTGIVPSDLLISAGSCRQG